MDILISNASQELLEKIREIVACEYASVCVIGGGRDISETCEREIILVGDNNHKTEWDDFLQPSKHSPPTFIIDDWLDLYEPPIELMRIAFQGIQEEMDIFSRNSKLKSKPDQKNIKCLSNRHNTKNKSILKRNNIKQQPSLCRRHGVDNRR